MLLFSVALYWKLAYISIVLCHSFAAIVFLFFIFASSSIFKALIKIILICLWGRSILRDKNIKPRPYIQNLKFHHYLSLTYQFWQHSCSAGPNIIGILTKWPWRNVDSSLRDITRGGSHTLQQSRAILPISNFLLPALLFHSHVSLYNSWLLLLC